MTKNIIIAISLCVGSALTIANSQMANAQTTNAGDSCSALVEHRTPKRLLAGFGFPEGIAWNKLTEKFVFSDIPGNTIYSIKDNHATEVFKTPSGYANGNAFDHEGNLWSAQQDRVLSRTTPAGRSEIVVNSFDGKKLNSPNDIAIAKDGAVWFTDPPFGIQGGGPQTAPEEQPVRGVYRYHNGKTTLATGELELPNGIAFSPDGASLYVANSADGAVYKFKVTEDGKLSEKSQFAILEPSAGESPITDGIKIDKTGNLWMTGPDGIGVFDTDGTLICKLDIEGKHVANLGFGGKDSRDIVIAVDGELRQLRAKTELR